MTSHRGLSVGAQAPDFTLSDFQRKPWSLSQALIQGPVVIIFFRGGWCPFCSAYLRRAKAELLLPSQKLGASLVAISSDAPGVPSELDDKSAFGFSILSDPDGTMLEAYQAANRLSPEEYAMEKEWHDIEAFSLNKKHLIAVPGVTVLNRQGRVIYNELNLDLNLRPEPSRILEALKKS